MDLGLVRRGLGTVAVFAAGLLAAALLARSPAFADQAGGPTHPDDHGCRITACFEIHLVDAVCDSGECSTGDPITFPKCIPVNEQSTCDESPSNGPSVTCFYTCTVTDNQGNTYRRTCAAGTFGQCPRSTVPGDNLPPLD